MDDGVSPRQPGEQTVQFCGGAKIPRSLHCGGGFGRIAEQVGLVEADDLDPRLREARIDGSGGREHDRVVAGALQAERAFERDLGLPAGDRGVVDRDDDIDAGTRFAHECSRRAALKRHYRQKAFSEG